MIQRAGKFAKDEKWREEKRSDDEKRGKTPLLLKRNVQMTKSAVKHHSYRREAFK